MNILTTLSALETLECFLLLVFLNYILHFAKTKVKSSLRFIEIKKKPTMGDVVVGG